MQSAMCSTPLWYSLVEMPLPLFGYAAFLPFDIELVTATGTPFDTVTVDEVELLSLRQNGVGFNVGVDAAYTITPMFGVGVLARYTRAGVSFGRMVRLLQGAPPAARVEHGPVYLEPTVEVR